MVAFPAFNLPAPTFAPRAKPVGGPLLSPRPPRLGAKTPSVTTRLRVPRFVFVTGETLLDDIVSASDAMVASAVSLNDPEFLPPTVTALSNAQQLILRMKVHALSIGYAMPSPSWDPAADGGIDLQWVTDRADLIIAVPREGSVVQYHGDTPSGAITKGTLPDAKTGVEALVSWLRTFL